MISIIIPCWGTYFKYLGECLDGLLEQVYKDFEVFVITKPESVAGARNKGLSLANGDYILCLDADDVLMPEFLEKTIRMFENNNEKIIVATDGIYFGEQSGKFIANANVDIIERNPILSCSVFPKKLWQEIGGFDEDLETLEDWDFWIRAVKRGYKIICLNEPLVKIRVSKEGRNLSTISKHADIAKKFRQKYGNYY